MANRQELLEKLKRYRPMDERDAAQKVKLEDFVGTHANCFNRSLLVGHITGSAWLVNDKRTHVLLTHHRKLNRWLQLGGHADGNPDVLDVALREAHEESGLDNLVPLSEEILDVDVHLIPAFNKESAHYHYDVRFILQAQKSQTLTVSSESNELCWVPIDSLETITQEESILRMKRKWLEWIRQTDHYHENQIIST